MSEEITISMIATDGKVKWIERSKVSLFREKGWYIIQNPKEKYYPQYDQALNKPQEDTVGTATRVIKTGFEDVLGIVIV